MNINKIIEAELGKPTFNKLTQEQEQRLIYEYKSGNTQQIKDNAQTSIINAYIRNIVYLINSVNNNNHIQIDDILAECIFSIKKSLDNYNLTCTTPFIFFYKKNLIHTINKSLNKENKYTSKKIELNVDIYNIQENEDNKDKKEQIQHFIKTKLKKQEKDIYSLYYENDMSVKQISKQLNKTPERIRQIKRQIHTKTKKYLLNN